MRHIKLDYLVALALCFALAYNVYWKRHSEPDPIIWAAPGEDFPVMKYARIVNSNADETSINRKSKIIYWSSAHCAWCISNVENIKTLARSVQAEYQFIAVFPDISDTEPYIKDNHLEFPIYEIALNDPGVRKLGGTPTTFVVGADGKIKQLWRGAYGGERKAEIEKAFGVSLPVDAVRAAKLSYTISSDKKF